MTTEHFIEYYHEAVAEILQAIQCNNSAAYIVIGNETLSYILQEVQPSLLTKNSEFRGGQFSELCGLEVISSGSLPTDKFILC